MSNKSKNNPKLPEPRLVGHIEPRPLDQLIPHAGNARTHSKAQIRQIAGSIGEFGFVNPILIGPDNGVVAGHARLRAAQELGMQEVPVIVLEHLSDAQRRALMLADNQLALNAGWDEELLRAELAALAKEEFPLDLIGFEEAELNRLLADQAAAEGLTDPDTAPPVPAVPVSQPGDLWKLGDHRLLCGDATQRADLDTVLAGETARMAFTDPPSDVPAETMQSPHVENGAHGRQLPELLREACNRLTEVCRGAIYICMPSSDVSEAFAAAGGNYEALLIWAKHHFTASPSDYQRQYEPILYGWPQGTDHYWCGARDQSDVWWIEDLPAKREHPEMQPVELVERAVENSSRAGDTVLDPFAGSGTTLIACERRTRCARLIELDARYVDVICQRWEQFRGQAVLDGSGKTFPEVARERQKKAGQHKEESWDSKHYAADWRGWRSLQA
jgi:DNA modification methylase